MRRELVNKGLIAAAAANIGGVLLFSRGFTNAAIGAADPVVMSNFGLLMICVWGTAYLGAAATESNIKWLAGAFAMEKLLYAAVWVRWFAENSLRSVYVDDLFAGIYFSIYGGIDFAFMVFFITVFVSSRTGDPR